jgi:hypothetical protein
MAEDSYSIESPDDTSANFGTLETAIAAIREKFKSLLEDRENARFYHGTILVQTTAGPTGVGGHTSPVPWRAFAEREGWARQRKELDYEKPGSN